MMKQRKNQWFWKKIAPDEVLAPWKPPAKPVMYKLDQAVKPAYKTPAASRSVRLSGFGVICNFEENEIGNDWIFQLNDGFSL